MSLKELWRDFDALLVLEDRGLTLVWPQGRWRFHPNMAAVRIKRLLAGQRDPLVEALCLRPGDRLLDATLGLGSDAIIAAHVAGPSGSVLACEASPLVAMVVEWGLRHWQGQPPELVEAMRRIQVLRRPHLEVLRSLPARSLDCVYFDPMFRRPRLASEPLWPLRFFASQAPLQGEALQEALRVARRRVVVREQAGSPEFARLGIRHFVPEGRRKGVVYGWLQPVSS